MPRIRMVSRAMVGTISRGPDTKKEKGELDDFIAQAERDRQLEEKLIQSKINTQKRKISMKEMLLTNFKTELDAILNS